MLCHIRGEVFEAIRDSQTIREALYTQSRGGRPGKEGRGKEMDARVMKWYRRRGGIGRGGSGRGGRRMGDEVYTLAGTSIFESVL